MDMEHCGRRGGLRPHFLCYTCDHFPVPGICAVSRLDPGKYFRQDLAGTQIWSLVGSVFHKLSPGMQRGVSRMLWLATSLSNLLHHVTVICPPTTTTLPICSAGLIRKGSRFAHHSVTKRAVGPPLTWSLSGCGTSCLPSLSFFVHILHIVICFLHFEITQNFWVWFFFLCSSCEVPFHLFVIQSFYFFLQRRFNRRKLQWEFTLLWSITLVTYTSLIY